MEGRALLAARRAENGERGEPEVFSRGLLEKIIVRFGGLAEARVLLTARPEGHVERYIGVRHHFIES